ncbi:MAG TPA: heptaprenyl diphosphate synthase component II [Bacillales bacterium]|nr:heptaprenyl diphosphate synthase component II [Bacillales bacterium]
MKLTELYRDLRSDLSCIEKELESAVNADHPELQKASIHLLKAGGKRIRPVFVLLCGQFGEAPPAEMKKVAVALELIHMASLVHDDVIDDAELRRGRQTIKAKWDNRVAMYTGDFMFSRALEWVASIENPTLHQVLSDAIVEMCLGEIAQIRDLYNWNQTLRNYLRRVRRKTALLIAVSCELGAIAGGCDKRFSKRLRNFGYYVGMSYQMTDDILDFMGTEKQLGKPAGSDLRQGNITLPVLRALKDPQRKEAIIAFLNDEAAGEQTWQQVLRHVKESEGIVFSQQLSARYLQKALNELDGLPDVKAKRSLHEIAGYIGRRKY